MSESEKILRKKDFVSDQEIKWCPGCGDYAILASAQVAMSKIGIHPDNVVCISGIGCSSRFPYYMNTYGLHTIHGRAPAFVTGLKVANPDLSVWMITGDGDGLSIGGNHLIHLIRRNVDVNVILFNNEIYGLTKGQYSPTSQAGLVSKSTPYGSIDNHFIPSQLCLGAGSTFFARTMDTNPKHMQEVMIEAQKHKGTSIIEVLQNCVIFNDKVHDKYTNRLTREDTTITVREGEPMIFGKELNKGLVLNGTKLEVVEVTEKNRDSLVVHDPSDDLLSYLLSKLYAPMPLAMGVLKKDPRSVYEENLNIQIQEIKDKNGTRTVKDLLMSGQTWQVE
jgi:2-oxoglutarate ferredoxin oxidoreductase subunit beta